ncbi:hypothetical protein JW948_16060 [bacterium]|nr:hypothetical protein [bacterium]
MEYTQSINNQNRLVSFSVRGNVAAKELCQAFTKMLNAPEFQCGYNSLWDFRHSNLLNPCRQFLNELLRQAEISQQKRGKNYKVAIVTGDDLTFGFARMFATYAHKLPCSVVVFRDIIPAMQWLTQ